MALYYSIDGNKVCAVGMGFQCLATCDAGFGGSLKEAFMDYYNRSHIAPVINDCRVWEMDWALEFILKKEEG